MNLIQQLQQTPKWKDFEEWYLLSEITSHIPLCVGRYRFPPFTKMNVCFQKGIFEKFIESQGFFIEQWYKTSVKQMYVCLFNDAQKESIFEGTFEELLIWYFNN